MRKKLAFIVVAAGLMFPGTAGAAHEQGRHDCFGTAVAAFAGPGLGQHFAFLAQTFQPLGAQVISIEARTCEEVLD